MNNYIILNKHKNFKNILKIIHSLNLQKSFKNNRTTIWENDDLQISIDKTIIRILIFSNDDIIRYRHLFLQGE